ncbi:YqcC family protein [Cellvibrio japonicus]|uniref:YqcC-like domain-containing protein n=1 Tax=Cellvibrio japonicus (strain Ueda107) TaxID=498211 RepID=B3PKE8_CELJU|nr:YqcC family protein [Cellvibrio japonicus]ACE83834.1 conserved hypothetical protein [Cellvibrio japonicus Ueda107]QEI12817.1 YqcC family protein [Cellvibrio japonicus]QEI16391.1 YqcC family protein [Cellvibrio japonicus]QEI19969.1 YqcC family protein [Cellvibrio japonicus]
MSHNLHIALAEILMDVEKELRELRLWECDALPEAALLSQQPFAIDTMSFPQWLQFIFLPRMYTLVEQQLPLPGNCGIAPMAEQYFAPLSLNTSPLIDHLQQIDRLLTRS